jgi:hypothetical protein
MSHAAVDWARADRTTTGNQRLLLLELAHYIDGNGEGWAARDRLLWGANMSLSSYRRALIALQRAGLVGVIVHGGGRGTGNDQYRPNAYYFLPMMSRDRIRTLGLEGVQTAPSEGIKTAPSEGVKTAPSEGVKTAPSYIKEDPYVDPYVDPPSSSELTNEPPVGTPQDDDDQASESEQDEHGAIIAAVCGQLAQHDLDQRPDHLDPVATPDRWLKATAPRRANATESRSAQRSPAESPHPPNSSQRSSPTRHPHKPSTAPPGPPRCPGRNPPTPQSSPNAGASRPSRTSTTTSRSSRSSNPKNASPSQGDNQAMNTRNICATKSRAQIMLDALRTIWADITHGHDPHIWLQICDKPRGECEKALELLTGRHPDETPPTIQQVRQALADAHGIAKVDEARQAIPATRTTGAAK